MSKERREQEMLGRRIGETRKRAGFSQGEVAGLLGFSRPTISEIERGKRRVDSILLRDLARLFGIQPWELLEPVEGSVQKERVYEALIRETQALSPADRKKINRLWQMLDDFAWLAEKMGHRRPDLPPSKRVTAHTPKYLIEGEAIQIREELGLGDSPLGPAIRDWLEAQGIPVFLEHFDKDPLSGLFINYPALGPVLLVNASQVTWRQAFTLAHEFAHVGLHRHEQVIASRIFTSGKRDARVIERQANYFAAEFLMPEHGIKRALEQFNVRSPLSPEDVVHLQRAFGVSYRAMLVRLQILGIITPQQHEQLVQQSPVSVASRLGYDVHPSEVGEAEGLPFYQKLPAEYLDLVLKAWEDKLIGEGKAARLLGLEERITLNSYVRALKESQERERKESVPLEVGG